MGVLSYVREKKRQVEAKYNTYKSRKAFYRKHPETELQELKDERSRLKKKQEIRSERKALRREALQDKLGAFGSLVAKPTVKKAQASRKVRQTYDLQRPNPAFGLGSSKNDFSLGGKPNPAFGFGKLKRK